ncbi:MAG: TraB/GumN family protein [Fluviicola sp.]|nr:TraB/GumN family protein [Fluviicola sp.]
MHFYSLRIRFIVAVVVLITTVSFSYQKNQYEYPLKETSLLWKIESPNSKKVSYLFGTMHLIEKEYFIFPEKLSKIVEKSDVLVMEMAGIPNQMEAMKYIVLSEGSFFDFFDDKQVDSIFIWAKNEMGLTPEAFRATFDKMKPFVAIQMASQLQFMGKVESYEISFDAIAKKNKIELIGLETIAQQMALFDNMTKSEQSQMVMEGIRDSKKSLETMKSIQQIYKRQQIDSLYMMIHSEGGIIAEKGADFLENRNKNWIPKIKEIITNKKAFIAVGAGHLGGPNGVIRLLEKEGYTLTPIKL